MSRRKRKHGRRLLLALLALIAALLAAAILRLSTGPLRLDALRPVVASALTPTDGSLRIEVGSTALHWRKGPRVLARDLEIVGPDGKVLGRFPEVAVAVSGGALLLGRIAVEGLELLRPVLRVVRGRDGHLELGIEPNEPAQPLEQSPVAGLLQVMLAPADPSSTLGALRRLLIQDADLEIEDRLLGVTWRAPDSDFEISRSSGGLRGLASLELDLAGRSSRVTAEFDHDRDAHGATLTLRISELDPEMLALVFPELELDQVVSVGIPLSGTLGLRMSVAEALTAIDVTEASFDITGSPGSIHLRSLGLDPLTIDGMRLAGRFHTDLTHLEVYDARLDIGGSRVSLAAWARQTGDDIGLRVDAKVRDFDVARLDSVWPPNAAVDARTWVVANIPSGKIAAGRLALSLRLPRDEFTAVAVDELHGSLDARELEVHYFRPLPPATRVSSAITFDPGRFDFVLRGGRLGDLAIRGGAVAITGMDEEDQVIGIEGDLAGPLRTALELLDHEPLSLLSDLRFDLSGTRGRVDSHLRLDFPLKKDLRPAEIAIDSISKLHAVETEDGPLGIAIGNGELGVEATDRSMRVAGDLTIAGDPAYLYWREQFRGDDPVTRITLTARAGEAARESLGLDGSDPVAGPVGIELDYAGMRDGSSRMGIDLDLLEASIDIPWIAWRKQAGTPGRGKLSIDTAGDGAVTIRKLRLETDDLQAKARLAFRPDSLALREVALDHLRYAEGDVLGSLRVEEDGRYHVELSGKRLDVGPALRHAASARGEGELPSFSLDARIGELRIGGEVPLSSFRATAAFDGDHFERARVEFGHGSAAGTLSYDPVGAGRKLAIRFGDLGRVLHATSFSVLLEGGDLAIDGQRSHVEAPVEGHFELANFRVNSDRSVTRLLQAFSLVHLIDAMRKEGLHFRSLHGDFSYSESLLQLPEARAEGASLGLTSRGTIDLGEMSADLEGKLLPLYTVNTMVSRIPVVGPAVTGADGALVGSSYRAMGPLGDLVVLTGREARANRAKRVSPSSSSAETGP